MRNEELRPSLSRRPAPSYTRAPRRSWRPVPLHRGHLPKRCLVLPSVREDPPHRRQGRYGHLRNDTRHCQ